MQRFDLADVPEPFLGISANVVEGQLAGFEALHPADQVAVNSATHDVYFGVGESLAAFQPDGEPEDFTAGPDTGTNEIPGSEVCGVAVDSSGDIYVERTADGSAGICPLRQTTGELCCESGVRSGRRLERDSLRKRR